jgi:DNA-binding NarL/FixJ family response regulator
VVIDAEITGPPSLADELIERLEPVERRWVEHVAATLEQLTPRERDVAERIAASHNIEGIAQALDITAKTVENHVGRVYHKLGLNDMRQESPDLRRAVVLAKAYLIHDLRTGEGK